MNVDSRSTCYIRKYHLNSNITIDIAFVPEEIEIAANRCRQLAQTIFKEI